MQFGSQSVSDGGETRKINPRRRQRGTALHGDTTRPVVVAEMSGGAPVLTLKNSVEILSEKLLLDSEKITTKASGKPTLAIVVNNERSVGSSDSGDDNSGLGKKKKNRRKQGPLRLFLGPKQKRALREQKAINARRLQLSSQGESCHQDLLGSSSRIKFSKDAWKRRRFDVEEVSFFKKILSLGSACSSLNGCDIAELPGDLLNKHLALVLGAIRWIGTNPKTKLKQFVELMMALSNRMLSDRPLRTHMLLLLQNDEFSKCFQLTMIYHENAHLSSDTVQRVHDVAEASLDDDIDAAEDEESATSSWLNMGVEELLCDIFVDALSVARDTDVAMATKTVTRYEGAILIDAIDVQTLDVLVTRMNSVALEEGTTFGPGVMQHPMGGNWFQRSSKVQVDKIFTSNARPALLGFRQMSNGVPVHSQRTPWNVVGPKLIWKKGDNLCQDLGVAMACNCFNHIWREAYPEVKTSPYCLTYQVFPTGQDVGLMELVPNAEPFKTFDWSNWAAKSNGDMQRRMLTSAAGAYIGGYVLGIRDRHWDNILIQNKDTLLHIDFGFLLGTQPPIDAPRFSISSDMKVSFGALGIWDEFVDMCLDAFMQLRRRSKDVIHACQLVFGMVLEWERSAITAFISESLMVNISDAKARKRLKQSIETASTAWSNWFKQFSHKTVDPVWYGLLRAHFPPAEMVMARVESGARKKAEAKKRIIREEARVSLFNKAKFGDLLEEEDEEMRHPKIDTEAIGVPLGYRRAVHWMAEINQIIKLGQLDRAAALLLANRDIEMTDSRGLTPLHVAVENNHLDFVKFLLFDLKANVNASDMNMWTPLHIACNNRNLDMVGLLMNAEETTGVPLNVIAQNSSGATPMHYLVRVRVTNADERGFLLLLLSDMIDAGLKFGGNSKNPLELVNSQGETPLHVASFRNATELDMIRFLVDMGSDVNVKTTRGDTPIQLAERAGGVKLKEMLIELGAKEI